MIEDTIERKHVGSYYADQQLGVMIIRGENVVLLGEIVYLKTMIFAAITNTIILGPGSRR